MAHCLQILWEIIVTYCETSVCEQAAHVSRLHESAPDESPTAQGAVKSPSCQAYATSMSLLRNDAPMNVATGRATASPIAR
jgi:hypothetical protein